ncbi:NADH-quinone oxidoreductase chain 5 [subsurface metagenome]|nr:NADH-quinone oxidoreductase subunit C [Dehalococcoidia bacterium]
MTKQLSGPEVAQQIGEKFPNAITGSDETAVFVRSEALLEVARFIKESLDLDYLNSITAVDYIDYFELVYHLTSLENNHSIILKTKCDERENPIVPSVVSLWQGADFQEREIYDLMGISFEGHPNMKRIFLWDGFQGHPLRKDFPLDVPGGGKAT